MAKRKRKIEGSAEAPEPGTRSLADLAEPDEDGRAAWKVPKGTGFPWPPLILIGVVVTVSLVVVSVRAARSNDTSAGPKVIHDAAYVTKINEACKAAFPDLRPKDTARDDVVTPDQAAINIRKAADGIEGLASTIRAIPATEAEKASVEGWLTDWATYVTIGRTYADIVPTDVARATQIGRTGDEAQRRADRFARGNGLTDCTFAVRFKAPPRQPGSL